MQAVGAAGNNMGVPVALVGAASGGGADKVVPGLVHIPGASTRTVVQGGWVWNALAKVAAAAPGHYSQKYVKSQIPFILKKFILFEILLTHQYHHHLL